MDSVADFNVLIVEDEMLTRSTLSALLKSSGYRTAAVGSAEHALKVLEAGHLPQIALVDLDLPGMNGAEFIAQLAVEHPSVFPVLITAAEVDRVARVLEPGVKHLRKPFEFNELLDTLARHS